MLETQEGEDGAEPQGEPGAGARSGTAAEAIVTSVTMPKLMFASTAALVALALSFTVLAGPLFALSERAAAELLAREPYISAVLGGER